MRHRRQVVIPGRTAGVLGVADQDGSRTALGRDRSAAGAASVAALEVRPAGALVLVLACRGERGAT